MKLILEEDNMKNNKEDQRVEILSESFLKFSDIQDLAESHLQRDSTRTIDRQNVNTMKRNNPPSESLLNYQSTKFRKNIDCMMMMKVNDQMSKPERQSQTKISDKFQEFTNNDSIVKDNLNSQLSMINSKINARRHKGFNKGLLIRPVISFPAKHIRKQRLPSHFF